MDILDFRNSLFEHIEGNMEKITGLNWIFIKTPPYSSQAQEMIQVDYCSVYGDASQISFLQFGSAYTTSQEPPPSICSTLVINGAVELFTGDQAPEFQLYIALFCGKSLVNSCQHSL